MEGMWSQQTATFYRISMMTSSLCWSRMWRQRTVAATPVWLRTSMERPRQRLFSMCWVSSCSVWWVLLQAMVASFLVCEVFGWMFDHLFPTCALNKIVFSRKLPKKSSNVVWKEKWSLVGCSLHTNVRNTHKYGLEQGQSFLRVFLMTVRMSIDTVPCLIVQLSALQYPYAMWTIIIRLCTMKSILLQKQSKHNNLKKYFKKGGEGFTV